MKFQAPVVSALTVAGLLLGVFPGEAQARRARRHKAPPAAAAPAAPEATPAAAPAKKENSCVAAFRTAQEHEQAGQLADARELWLKCAKATCGSFLKQECTTRYTQLDGDIPSIVPLVTDEAGTPRVDVQVRIDDKLVASQLDGRALQCDPGMHEFTFSADGNVFSKQKIMILQGQRNRQISASLHAPGRRAAVRSKTAIAEAEKPAPEAPAAEVAASKVETETPPTKSEQKSDDAAEAKGDDGAAFNFAGGAPDPDEPRGESHKLSYLLAGVGVAGLSAGALMIYWGRKDNDLLSTCSPGCPPGNVSHIRHLYLAGDIVAGVGVASLAASYLVYALTHSKEEKATQEAYLFHVAPTSSGAVAGISGSF